MRGSHRVGDPCSPSFSYYSEGRRSAPAPGRPSRTPEHHDAPPAKGDTWAISRANDLRIQNWACMSTL